MSRILVIAILMISPAIVMSQSLFKGIVVDSLTLENIPGVQVFVKNKNHVAISDSQGIFAILAKPGDTLMFSFMGYRKYKQTVHEGDDVMFVRLSQESTMLREIVIRETALQLLLNGKKYIESKTLSTTKPLASGYGSLNFAYFTKLEKEKRKLVVKIEELERARAYIEIVNDEEVRELILKNYSLTEDRYYDLLAIFNQTHDAVIHSSNVGLILNELFSYFEKATEK